MEPRLEDPHPPQNPEQVDSNVFVAVKNEVQHEVAHIRDNKEPVDPTESDVLVQKHVSGLFIILLTLVALFLIAAIVGIALWKH